MSWKKEELVWENSLLLLRKEMRKLLPNCTHASEDGIRDTKLKRGRLGLRQAICIGLLLLAGFEVLVECAAGQTRSYWQRSFNEESALLAGAVVGGGSGPSAIYYNPASISEISQSKFTLNASLFSMDFIHVKNALGDGIDLKSTKGIIEPRFVSYMIASRRNPKWNIEIAFLNNENTKFDIISAVDYPVDVLPESPGMERYFSVFQYQNHFRDDWGGLGASVKVKDRLSLGMAMFVAVKSCEYVNSLMIEAMPSSDTSVAAISGEYGSSSGYNSTEYLKYNDYRLLWKAGARYKIGRVSLGLTVTTPSIGVYSDGKRVTHTEMQRNISSPETGEPIPDYLVADYQEKKKVTVNFKTPFAIAAGSVIKIPEKKRTLYLSTEYFQGIDPYRLIEASEGNDIVYGTTPDPLVTTDWLTYVSGARHVLNAAVGYSWTLKENLDLKAGFRTDFNYLKNLDFASYAQLNRGAYILLDYYHITGGLAWIVFGQNIITGFEYTVAGNRNLEQKANLTDPLEYNSVDGVPLQGYHTPTMDAWYNSISLYLGASFNFGGNGKK